VYHSQQSSSPPEGQSQGLGYFTGQSRSRCRLCHYTRCPWRVLRHMQDRAGLPFYLSRCPRLRTYLGTVSHAWRLMARRTGPPASPFFTE